MGGERPQCFLHGKETFATINTCGQSILESMDFSAYSSKIHSLVEEKKVWMQEFMWENTPIVLPFEFPAGLSIEQIRNLFAAQGIKMRIESQKTRVTKTDPKEMRVIFRCSARFKKRAVIENRQKQTRSRRTSDNALSCAWSLNLKKSTVDNVWKIYSGSCQHTNHLPDKTVCDDLKSMVTSISEFSDENVAEFVRLYTAQMPTPCIRRYFEGLGLSVDKKVFQNLRRKLHLDHVADDDDLYPTLGGHMDVPETIEMLLQLKKQKTAFVICWKKGKLLKRFQS